MEPLSLMELAELLQATTKDFLPDVEGEGLLLRAAECVKTVALLNELADDECRSVDLFGANPGFDGPSYSIEVLSFGVGNEKLDRFDGKNLLDCLRQAVAHYRSEEGGA